MSADQLATRILSEQAGISSENLRMGKITTSEFRNLARAASDLQTLPLFIDDTPALTIAALRTRARRMKRQHKIGFVHSFDQFNTQRHQLRFNNVSIVFVHLTTICN